MEIALYGVVTDETLRPDEVARLIEDAGFDASVGIPLLSVTQVGEPDHPSEATSEPR